MRKFVAAIAVAGFSVAAAADEAATALTGTWLGRIEYASSADPMAHSEQLTAFTIDREGRIEGYSLANGCAFSGKAKPGSAPREAELKVSFSGCRYLLLNRSSFTGSMKWDGRSQSARLDLQREDPAGEQVALYQITGFVVP